MNTSSIIYQSFRGLLILLALALTLAGCGVKGSGKFSAALSVDKSELKPGESTGVYADLENHPDDLNYRWSATGGQCDPQESKSPATQYIAPISLSQDEDLTIQITAEFFQAGKSLGKKGVSITIKKEEIAQQQAESTAQDNGPVTPTAPEGPNSSGSGYPTIESPNRLTKDDVRRLAEFYGLTKSWKTNLHLRFKEGDISHFHEQKLSEDELNLEFESRRIILVRAEKTGEVIPTQGDLSHLAQTEQPYLKQTKPSSTTSAASIPEASGSGAQPTIRITQIPPYDPVGGPDSSANIAGEVSGVNPLEYRVVLYARTDKWYVQPLIAEPFTDIKQSGAWSNWTHAGAQFAALLVKPSFKPPNTAYSLPDVGGDVVAITTVRGRRP